MTAAEGQPRADRLRVDPDDGEVAAAKALAMTALDLLAEPQQLRKAKEEFARG